MLNTVKKRDITLYQKQLKGQREQTLKQKTFV